MKATKYHINNDGEARPCGAKVKCRFGGESGVENHFSSAEAAEVEVQKRLQKEFSHVSSMRQKGTSAQFVKNREAIKTALVSFGAVKNADSLPEVRNTDEMVEKWFDGDSSRYKSFKRLTEANDITTDTKKSVASFVQKGLPVNISSTVHDVPHSRSDDKFEESEIDLLEDIPNGKINLEELRSGKLRAFR